jgi:hypothetical protein
LKYIKQFTVLFFFFSGVVYSSYSQTKVRGYVFNDETSEVVPFASISFMGTTYGCLSDVKGEFFLESDSHDPHLIVSCMGYKNDTLLIEPDKYQELSIYLTPESFSIQEIIVRAGENPAIALIKKVQKNKNRNNINRLKTYSYEQYTKMQVDLNNFDPNIKDNALMKDFQKAFEGLDTSSVSGKTYMPLILSETLSDYYFQDFPRHRKEYIKAVNVSGVENLSAGKFTGQMYVDFNFYMNFITILEKQFVSPLSLTGLLTYDYYLTDSTVIDDSWCYHLAFKPKRKHEFTFKGDMWIADTTFALKRISAQMSETANLAFVSDFYVKHDYKRIDDFYFPEKEEFFIDFNISKITTGFFGRKYTSRTNIVLNPEFKPLFFSLTEFREIETDDKALEYDSLEWKKLRHKELSQKEKDVYQMVNIVKSTPSFRRVENFSYFIGTGYIRKGYFEFGPYYKVYSKNAIEGDRFRLGIRSSNTFSKKIELNAYGAFGFQDQKGKYGVGTKWKIQREPWTLAQINYYEDLIQLGANLSNFGTDNIFSVSGNNDKLLFIKNIEIGIERDLMKSLNGTLFYSNKEIFPTDSILFIGETGANIPRISASEFTLSLRFGINEEYIESVFHRQSFGSLYPIIEFKFTKGVSKLVGVPYPYQKYMIGFKHHISYGFAGKTKYYVESGIVNGRVPFPLLQLHEGKIGIAYDEYSFNLMNFYEFASDRYISFFGEHHFNGLFLNRIPFLRKLKFREVVYAKGVWGSLKDDNRNLLQFPGTLSDVTKPYVEMGVGVENILNFLSINYFRRVTHIHKEGIRKNGIIIGFKVSF